MEDLIYKVDRQGEVVILTLTLNNITMHQNEELQKAFTTLLDGGSKNIVLDLVNTYFISSIVIASLVFMLKRAREAGGDIVLCNIKDAVRKVLAITNLDKVFAVFDDRQKAIGRFVKK